MPKQNENITKSKISEQANKINKEILKGKPAGQPVGM